MAGPTTKIGFQTSDPAQAKAGSKAPAPSRAALQNVVQKAPSSTGNPGKSEIKFGKQPGGYGGSSTSKGTIKVSVSGTNLQN